MNGRNDKELTDLLFEKVLILSMFLVIRRMDHCPPLILILRIDQSQSSIL